MLTLTEVVLEMLKDSINMARVPLAFAAGNYGSIPVGPQDSGSGSANFLLGYAPAFTSRGTPGTPPFLSNKEISFFGQDDWKVNETLTLNLGLRWDLFTQPTERFDRQANYNPANDTLTRAGENVPGGRDLVNSDWNNFGPSVGFAWSGLKSEERSLFEVGMQSSMPWIRRVFRVFFKPIHRPEKLWLQHSKLWHRGMSPTSFDL